MGILQNNYVLVLGKSGQVAKSLYKFKENAKFEIKFLDRNQIDLDAEIYTKLKKYVIEFNPKFIVNAAAYTAVEKAENDIESAMKINGYSVGNIAKLCSEFDIPLFHFSTDYVFGDDGKDFLSPLFKKKPTCIYGKSKLLGEKLIKKYVDKFILKAIVLRVSWVFSENENNFVNTIINLSNTRDEIKIINDQFGGPTSSDSIAIATINIINTYLDNCSLKKVQTLPWGEYNFQGQPIINWYEFANFIINEAEKLNLVVKRPKIKSISSNEYKFLAKRQLNSRLCMESSKSKLALIPSDWKKDLVSCLKIKKNNLKRYSSQN